MCGVQVYVVGDSIFFFFQAEDGIRDYKVTGVQTCALPISNVWSESDSVVYLISPPWVSRILNTSLTPGSPTSSTTTPNSTSPNMLLVAEIGRASCRERV